MIEKNTTQRSYMALAPISALAGIFINPLASTVMPFIFFFIFRTSRPEVSKVALQTADLAFSIQLWIMLISLALMLGISLDLILAIDAKEITFFSTIIIMLLFVISLFFAIYQAMNGRTCTHLLSFKIAERVFNLINSPNTEKNKK